MLSASSPEGYLGRRRSPRGERGLKPYRACPFVSKGAWIETGSRSVCGMYIRDVNCAEQQDGAAPPLNTSKTVGLGNVRYGPLRSSVRHTSGTQN